MAASADTIQKVLAVVLRHVDGETAGKIVRELRGVPGNKSFRETVERLEDELRRKRQ